MKINKINKKVIVAISSVAIVLGLIISIGHGQINTAENNYTCIDSAILNIKDNAINNKKTLIDLEANVQNLNPNKDDYTELKIVIEELEKANFRDTNKINENIQLCDKLNTELDKVINIFESNEAIKNDIEISNKMIEVKGIDNLIDNIMFNYNSEERKNFNESINKFPVKLVVKTKGWYAVDEFKSIK